MLHSVYRVFHDYGKAKDKPSLDGYPQEVRHLEPSLYAQVEGSLGRGSLCRRAAEARFDVGDVLTSTHRSTLQVLRVPVWLQQ